MGSIIMWDKGCRVPHAIAFAIPFDKEVMEGASQDDQVIKDYNNLK
jgi:hypothetical protein